MPLCFSYQVMWRTMSMSHCLFSRAAIPLRFATRNCRRHTPTYNQIDYITVSQRYKISVRVLDHGQAVLYPATIGWWQWTSSNQAAWVLTTHINKLTIDTDNIIQYKDLQKEFADAVALILLAVPLKKSSWNEFGAVLQKVTKEKIRLQSHRRQGTRNALEDPEVKVLVAEVRKLSMDENAAQTRSQKAAVKSKLGGRRRELTTILRKKGGQDLEKAIAEVEPVKNEGRKMIAALRPLNNRPPNEWTIVDAEGKVVYRLKSQLDMLAFHFKCLFAPDSIGNLTQHQATLQHPMSAMEVQTAAVKLKIKCTCGPDLVPNEPLKYAYKPDNISLGCWPRYLLVLYGATTVFLCLKRASI